MSAIGLTTYECTDNEKMASMFYTYFSRPSFICLKLALPAMKLDKVVVL